MIRKLTSYSLPPNSTNSKFAISNSNLKQALLEMAFQGTEMKFEGYDLLLNECVSQKGLIEGQRVQAHMIKTQYLPPVYLRNRLIVFYTKCECLEDARMVFDEIPERNVVSWTAMISGYSRRGYASEALVLFVEMLKSGIEPNEFTFATVLTSCSGVSGLLHGRQIHSHIIKLSFDAHVYVGSSLLDLYAKTGWIHEARVVFDGLPERDVVSCTAIISGYAQLGFDEEALKLFCQLQEEGMISNYVTYASVLTAISGLAAYEHGRQVHSHMASAKPFATAAGTLRSRLSTSLRLRGGGAGPSRWTSPGHQEHPNGYFLNRTPLPPGQSRKWEDWELPCYVTSFLTIVILGVGLNAKPDLTIETWAHQKALERLEAQQMAPLSDESD
uniref:Uncharacterized protein n=2 Tax=Daucus carota subsp. sativus TaxID=79200 RepID=A0A165YGN5_DAUCS